MKFDGWWVERCETGLIKNEAILASNYDEITVELCKATTTKKVIKRLIDMFKHDCLTFNFLYHAEIRRGLTLYYYLRNAKNILGKN